MLNIGKELGYGPEKVHLGCSQEEQLNPAGAFDQGGIGFELFLGKSYKAFSYSFLRNAKQRLADARYSSVVEHSTADPEVPSTNLRSPFFREVKRNIFLRNLKAGMICHFLNISNRSIFVSVPTECKAKMATNDTSNVANVNECMLKYAEYYERFFAKLPALGKKAVFGWCMKTV
ncbi:hypothetical protein TNCV_1161011 [Trichonephila clavipes]|nr:hypothetical protein TNCV_1161011 [Trichonephila clavipes]